LQIRPNRYAPIRIDHVATSDLKRIRFRISNQIPFQSCKIHIFRFISPKIANNIPLESLGHLESSSTIISYILWVQFESIFRIKSNLRLTCLIHIFYSVYPKITNLLSLESSNLVEHHRIKKIQIWYVHTLCALKFVQITNLIIVWIL
jgi:hypothetical protein